MKARKIQSIVSLILMWVMLVFIGRYFPIKALLLFVLCILCEKKVYVSKPVIFLVVSLCLSTLWGMIVGVLKNTDAPAMYLGLGFLWPILSLFIVLPQLKTNDDFEKLFKYLFYIHSFLILYDVGFALSVIYDFPYYDLYPEVETGFSFYETSSRMNFPNLNVLTYTVPIYFLIFLSKYEIGISRKIQGVFLLLSFFLLIVCGRRSLMSLFFLSPIACLVFERKLPKDMAKRTKKYLLVFLLLLGTVVTYYVVFEREVADGYTEAYLSAFDSDEEPVKYKQAVMFWESFQDSPFLGQGSGKSYYEPVRSRRGTTFEVVYLLMLATRGIIGFVLYIIGIVGPFFIGMRYALKYKDALFIFMLISYGFIIIAEITNPIMNGFDLILPLLFCYAKINSLASNKKIITQ